MELKNLDAALRLLSLFSPDVTALGVREIATRLNLSPSVVHRIVATYVKHGFLRQDAASKKYALGVRFWEIGILFRANFSLDESVQALLDDAASATGETVYLNLLDGNQALCVQIAESKEGVKVAIRLGDRTPLHSGSRGKVMLAFLAQNRRELIVEQAFSSEEGSVEYSRQLDGVRRTGWCLSVGERLPGVTGISLPIFDRQSNVIASVTVGGPQARMTAQKIDACLPIMQRLATQIQTNLQKFN